MKDYIIVRNLRKFTKKDDVSKTFYVLEYAQQRTTRDNEIYFKEQTAFLSEETFKKLKSKNFVYGDIAEPIVKQVGFGVNPELVDLNLKVKSSYKIG